MLSAANVAMCNAGNTKRKICLIAALSWGKLGEREIFLARPKRVRSKRICVTIEAGLSLRETNNDGLFSK
jgi:hypothetical protein